MRASVEGLAVVLVLIAVFPSLGCLGPAARDRGLRIAFVADPDCEGSILVEVTGLEDEILLRLETMSQEGLRHLFRVETATKWTADGARPPISGETSVSVAEGRVCFRPRYPLVRGLSYRARFDASSFGAGGADSVVTVPRVGGEPTTYVTAVYPTSDRLPMNLLKVYLCFSDSMSVGEAYERVRLFEVDHEGRRSREVLDGFLPLEQELWDPGRKRLTLLFDPGRIKRGLVPHQEQDLPLQDGRRYVLSIDPTWSDGEGRPLRESFEKWFRVVAPDRKCPDPRSWTIETPPMGSTRPLRIRFDEALDYGMLFRVVGVWDERGQPVAGRIEVLEEDRIWSLTPELPWSVGEHDVRVLTSLEDVAGNSLRAVFDVDPTAPPQGVSADEVLLTFAVADAIAGQLDE